MTRKNWIDDKAIPQKYKVNVLNGKGKEVWRYFNSIKTARSAQQRAEAKALHSCIYQKKNGEYHSI